MSSQMEAVADHSANVDPLVAMKKRVNERRRRAARISRFVVALSMLTSVGSIWVGKLVLPALLLLGVAIAVVAWLCWLDVNVGASDLAREVA